MGWMCITNVKEYLAPALSWANWRTWFFHFLALKKAEMIGKESLINYLLFRV